MILVLIFFMRLPWQNSFLSCINTLVSGKMAAAITRGVQSKEGVGTTIKHFACNSQEDNRMGSNSILSERTLREIYLRGFEIAVKTSQPMAIMTSYNLINGVHAANCKDICTVAARKEWDFQGIIMHIGQLLCHRAAVFPGNVWRQETI